MNGRPSARAPRSAASVSRLLSAAIGILRDEGPAAVSIQRVADAAGTSKGLVHYHFADKDALLTACAIRLTAELIEHETSALSASTAATALDDLWALLSSTEHQGRRRALLALAAGVSPGTRSALADAATQRQRAAVRTIETLRQLIQFDGGASRAALAMAFQALVDGLTLDAHAPMTLQHRQAYDAFWLAVLSVAG